MHHHHTIYSLVFLFLLGIITLSLFLEGSPTGLFVSSSPTDSLVGETLLADCSQPEQLGADFAQSIIQRHFYDLPCSQKQALCLSASRDAVLPGEITVSFSCRSPAAFADSCISTLSFLGC